jgi:hypothetical protein
MAPSSCIIFIDIDLQQNKQSLVLMSLTLTHLAPPNSLQILAVVDDKHALHLYTIASFGSRKSAVKHAKTLSPSDGVTAHVEDCCFFAMGPKENLLLADPTQDDVLVLDLDVSSVSGALSVHVLGHLTDQNGNLKHPSAFYLDSTTGHLYVACEGESIVVLRGTC